MSAKSSLTLLAMTAAALTFGVATAKAGPDLNIRVNGYLPAPPGVYVLVDSGRPYYVERERRVYLEREKPGKHHKKKKHHHDNGNKYGHYKDKKHH